jgi:glycosyltransferase involved in cell wall biosynthesis
MQNGAYEAMELERPIITSDWPVLRETFSRGTVHVDNKAESIVKAIEEIQKNYSYYLDEIKQLRLERRAVWEQGFSALIALMESKQTNKNQVTI